MLEKYDSIWKLKEEKAEESESHFEIVQTPIIETDSNLLTNNLVSNIEKEKEIYRMVSNYRTLKKKDTLEFQTVQTVRNGKTTKSVR